MVLQITDFITWILIVAGWAVFDRLARARDQKNRFSSQIDDAVALVEKIEEEALRLWQSPGLGRAEQDLQRTLMIMQIDHLEGRISGLGHRKPDIGFDSEINDLSKSILDDDGESLNRTALGPDDPRFDRIADAARKLRDRLRKDR